MLHLLASIYVLVAQLISYLHLSSAAAYPTHLALLDLIVQCLMKNSNYELHLYLSYESTPQTYFLQTSGKKISRNVLSMRMCRYWMPFLMCNTRKVWMIGTLYAAGLLKKKNMMPTKKCQNSEVVHLTHVAI
jgi:hypothetical protein